MKERPILFSTEMVQAILAGRKTQTRRVVKPQLEDSLYLSRDGSAEYSQGTIVKCPYGKVGDVLWVKENFYAFGVWVRNGLTKTGKQKWKFVRDKDVEIRYEENKPDVIRKNSYRGVGWYKRSSLYMEREMARLFLRITNIRVERLQNISMKDAKNEGIESFGGQKWKNYLSDNYLLLPTLSFQSLWESINGEQSWNDNPFVWVIEFERIFKTK